MYIFHGDQDQIIPIQQSKKLTTDFSDKIQLIELSQQNHNNMTENEDYQMQLAKIMLEN